MCVRVFEGEREGGRERDGGEGRERKGEKRTKRRKEREGEKSVII